MTKKTCKESTYIKSLNVALFEDTIECTGGKINYELGYELVHVDKNCKETSEYKYQVSNLPWVILPCNEDKCCKDHIIQEVKRFIYNTETEAIEECIDEQDYNDDEVIEKLFSVKMVADIEHKCNPNCGCIPIMGERKYCVDKDSVEVLYESDDENDKWKPNGILPISGGTVIVTFRYSWVSTSDNCEETKILSGFAKHYTSIFIPPCSCEDGECFEDLVGEIEFKTPQYEGCNIVEYHVRQETCKKEEK